MGFVKEARLIYLYSRELADVNKRLKKLGIKAEKHKVRHERAAEHKKEKHKVKHHITVKQIEKLMRNHNELLNNLKTHYQRYAHYLRKEHKV